MLGKQLNGSIIRALLEELIKLSGISNMIPRLGDRILAERFKNWNTLKSVSDEVQKCAETWSTQNPLPVRP